MRIKTSEVEAYQKFKEVNSKDAYSKGIITYIEKWSELMEKEIENGKKLEDIAKTTSCEADTDGITGYMYGVAVRILSGVWEYGEELRKWHNKEYGYEGEGCINPAIITIGVKE